MKNLIGNDWKDAQDGKTIDVLNPFDNSIIDTVPNSTLEDVILCVKESINVKEKWKNVSIYERSQMLMKFVSVIKEKEEELIDLLVMETGKCAREVKKELRDLSVLTNSLIEKAKHLYGDVLPIGNEPDNKTSISFTTREPHGVVAAIIPYNIPLTLFGYKVIGALIMGNTVIVKPSSKAPLTITKLVYLLRYCGVPSGVVQVIHGEGRLVGQGLSMHPDINFVTFSGSTVTGMKVMEAASKNLKRLNLELSGNNAFIVCSDADIDLAVEEASNDRFYNSGQMSNCGKRFLVHSSIKDEFVNKLIKKIGSINIGNPNYESTDMGCMISEKAAMKVENQVAKLIELGAKIAIGGNRENAFYEPTILINVTKEMPVASNMEIFGPVVPIIEYNELDEALEIANQSPFGIGASIFTNDNKLAFKLASLLEVGNVVINGGTLYRTHEMPFGGWKYSGMGAEGVVGTLEGMSVLKTTILKDILD